MTRSNEQKHDWEGQLRDTEQVVSDLRAEGVDFSKELRLDFQFLPADDTAESARFAHALRAAGYEVDFYEDDPTVEASVPSISPTLENIWHHEMRTTKIALQFGFRPDGWGFLSDQ